MNSPGKGLKGDTVKKFAWLGLVILGILGCASEDLVKDGDRQLLHQNVQGLTLVAALLDAVFNGNSEAAGQAVGALAIIIENSKQLVKNVGMPKDPKPFGAVPSKEAREQSEREHTKKWYMAAGSAILSIGLSLLVNKFAPGLGMFVSSLTGGLFKSASTKTTEATFAGIEQFMRNNPGISEKLVPYLSRAQEKLGVDKFAGKILAGVKTFILPQLPAGAPETAPEPEKKA